MRKTSQDGGDATSITSGVENEIKKSAAGIVKIKRNSIKRKVQSFSNESDDGVGEPLLQREKEKTEGLSQSAKFLLSKTKTDIKNDKSDDKEKPFSEDKVKKPAVTSFSSTADSVANGTKDNYKFNGFGTSAVHNHMNTNVFGNSEGLKNVMVPKTQILVEIDTNKSNSYNSGPLIFTTAKIHTDGTKKNMEPVQVTLVPILSTVEGNVIKTTSIGDAEHKGNKINSTFGGDVKKIDTGLSTVFGNNFKESPKATDYSTIIPNVSSKPLEQNATIQAVMNKTNATIGSKIPNEMSQPSKVDINSQKPEISAATVINETKPTQPLKHEPKPPVTSQQPIITSSSIKVDVNKNFEPSPNVMKQSDQVKLVDSSITKQLQRQKTLKESEDTVKPVTSRSSEPTKTQTVTAVSNVTTVTKDKPATTTNSFSKPVSTGSVAKPTTSITNAITVSTSTVIPNTTTVSVTVAKPTPTTVSTAYNVAPTVNVKTKTTTATSAHTVNVMSIASQVKPNTTLEPQKSIATSGIPKKTTTQAGKNAITPSSKSSDSPTEIVTKSAALQQKDNVKIKPSSTPSIKSSVPLKSSEKNITAPKPNTSTTKSMDISPGTTSNNSLISNSKPVTIVTCSNAIKTDNSLKTKPSSNVVISTGSANHTTDNKTSNTIPRVVSETHAVKTTNSVTPTSIKLQQSSSESRGTVAGKSVSTAKTTSSSSSPSTNVSSSKTPLTTSSKTNNTQASSTVGVTSVKSPTTPKELTTPKPSVTHNQTQLERSETKKEKLK